MKQKHPLSLNDIGNQHPFKVPENYFEELPMHIQNSVRKTPRFQFPSVTRWALVVSTVSAIVVLGFVLLNTSTTPQISTEQLLSEIHTEDLMAYLEDLQLDEEEYINDINKNFTGSSDLIPSQNIDNQSLIEYQEDYLPEQDDYEYYEY